MLALSKHHDRDTLNERLRDAPEVTAELMSEVLAEIPLSVAKWRGNTDRIEQLIRSGAWTDAALALIDPGLPQWRLRRIAYDEGEWHCALSRQRELPEWLDHAIETRHTDLPLAILGAFIEAQRSSARSSRISCPFEPRAATGLYEPVLTDNFG